MSPRPPFRFPLFQGQEEGASSERPLAKPTGAPFSPYSKERPITALEEASASMREYSQKYRRDLCLSTCITTLLQHELPWLSTRDGPDAAHSQGEQALHKLLGEKLFNMQRLLTDPTALRRECQDAVQICTFLE